MNSQSQFLQRRMMALERRLALTEMIAERMLDQAEQELVGFVFDASRDGLEAAVLSYIAAQEEKAKEGQTFLDEQKREQNAGKTADTGLSIP
jgi:hypothetical protein